MADDIKRQTEQSFRRSAAAGVALVTLMVGAPFGVLNLLEGNYDVAASAIGMTLLLSAHASALRWAPRWSVATSLLIIPGGLMFLAVAIQVRGVLGLFWAFPAVIGFYCLFREPIAWLANITTLLIVVPLAYHTVEFAFVLRASATLVAVSLFSAVLLNVIHRHHRLLIERIETDVLTGVFNRQPLRSALASAFAGASRKKPVSLIAIDIDHFKRINDRHGHATGDQVLQRLGATLQNHLSADDTVFRTGGDEFLVLLHTQPGASSREAAERLRSAVQQALSTKGDAITLCAGIASHADVKSVDEWLIAADYALYQAKAAGRNCTRSFVSGASSAALAFSLGGFRKLETMAANA